MNRLGDIPEFQEVNTSDSTIPTIKPFEQETSFYQDRFRRRIADVMGKGTGETLAPTPEKTSVVEDLVAPARDVAAGLGGAVLGAAEAVKGLGSLATGGYAGKILDAGDKWYAEQIQKITGFNPKDTPEEREALYSKVTQEQRKNVREAEGFADTLYQAATNPLATASYITESAGVMGLSGAMAKGLVNLGLKNTALAAGAGEGIVMAGSQAEQIRSQTEDKLLGFGGTAASLGTGALGSVIGVLGGKLASRVDAINPEEVFTGKLSKVTGNWLSRGLKSGGIESLEELGQSGVETILANAAVGKPLTEGLGQSMALGAVTGFGMGFGVGIAVNDKGQAINPDTSQPFENKKVSDTLVKIDNLQKLKTSQEKRGVDTAPTIDRIEKAKEGLSSLKKEDDPILNDEVDSAINLVENQAKPTKEVEDTIIRAVNEQITLEGLLKEIEPDLNDEQLGILANNIILKYSTSEDRYAYRENLDAAITTELEESKIDPEYFATDQDVVDAVQAKEEAQIEQIIQEPSPTITQEEIIPEEPVAPEEQVTTLEEIIPEEPVAPEVTPEPVVPEVTPEPVVPEVTPEPVVPTEQVMTQAPEAPTTPEVPRQSTMAEEVQQRKIEREKLRESISSFGEDLDKTVPFSVRAYWLSNDGKIRSYIQDPNKVKKGEQVKVYKTKAQAQKGVQQAYLQDSRLNFEIREVDGKYEVRADSNILNYNDGRDKELFKQTPQEYLQELTRSRDLFVKATSLEEMNIKGIQDLIESGDTTYTVEQIQKRVKDLIGKDMPAELITSFREQPTEERSISTDVSTNADISKEVLQKPVKDITEVGFKKLERLIKEGDTTYTVEQLQSRVKELTGNDLPTELIMSFRDQAVQEDKALSGETTPKQDTVTEGFKRAIEEGRITRSEDLPETTPITQVYLSKTGLKESDNVDLVSDLKTYKRKSSFLTNALLKARKDNPNVEFEIVQNFDKTYSVVGTPRTEDQVTKTPEQVQASNNLDDNEDTSSTLVEQDLPIPDAVKNDPTVDEEVIRLTAEINALEEEAIQIEDEGGDTRIIDRKIKNLSNTLRKLQKRDPSEVTVDFETTSSFYVDEDEYSVGDDYDAKVISSNVDYSLIGIKGANNLGDSAMSGYKLAIALANKKVPPAKIFKETGWIKNPKDNKWRFEIDDSTLQIKQDPNLDLNNYELLNNQGKKPLGDIISHPTLFKAYPNLANLIVKKDRYLKGSGAFFASGTKESVGRPFIALNYEKLDAKALGTLIHEIQHYIQETENLPRGGSPTMFSEQGMLNYVNNVIDNLKSTFDKFEVSELLLLNPLKLESLNLTDTAVRSEVANIVRSLPLDKVKTRKSYYKRNLDYYRDIKKKLTSSDINVKRKTVNELGLRMYENLVGELEAVDTAKRRELSAEQRQALLPYSYTFFDKETALIRMGDGQISMSQGYDDYLKSQLPIEDKNSTKYAIVKERAAKKGLDISDKARLSRAKAQGFNTDKVWYHGTMDKRFMSFDPNAQIYNRTGKPGIISLSSSKDFADARGIRTIPTFVKDGNIFDFRKDLDKIAELFDMNNGSDRAMFEGLKTGRYIYLEDSRVMNWIKDNGYTGFYMVEGEGGPLNINIFDPTAIRATTAIFDPAQDTSANIAFSLEGQGNDIHYEKSKGAVAHIFERVNKKNVTLHTSEGSKALKISLAKDVNELPEKYDRTLGIKGLYDRDTNEIWIVSNNHNSTEEVVKTVAHELVGHVGLKRLLGQGYNHLLNRMITSDLTLLEDILSNVPKWSVYLEQWNQTHDINTQPKDSIYKTRDSNGNEVLVPFSVAMRLADEYIANIAEQEVFFTRFISERVGRSKKERTAKRNKRAKLIDQFITKVKHVLRKVFGKYSDSLSRTDLLDIIAASTDHVFRDTRFDYTKIVNESEIENFGISVKASYLAKKAAIEQGAEVEKIVNMTKVMTTRDFGQVNKSAYVKLLDDIGGKIKRHPLISPFFSLGSLQYSKHLGVIESIQSGKLEELKSFSRDFFKMTKNLNETQTSEIYLYFTTANAEVPTINYFTDERKNQELSTKIVEAKQSISDLGRALVGLGLLDSETYLENEGSYLPARYVKWLTASQGGKFKTSFMDYLKQKDRSMSDLDRDMLGLIKDPAFLVAETINKIGRDVTLVQMYNAIYESSSNNGFKWILGNEAVLTILQNGKRKEINLDEIERHISHYEDLVKIHENAEKRKALNFSEETYLLIKNKLEEYKGYLNEINQTIEGQVKGMMQRTEGRDPTSEEVKAFINKEYKQMPVSQRYGNLSGKYIRKEIYNSFFEIDQAFSEASSQWRSGALENIHAFFKLNKVAFNPASHIRNGMSNAMLLDLSTHTNSVTLTKWIGETVANIANKKDDRFLGYSKSFGLFGITMSAQELHRFQTEFSSSLKRAEATSPIEKTWAFITENFSKTVDLTSKVFGLTEGVFKTVALKDYILRYESQKLQPGQTIEDLELSERNAVIAEAAHHASKVLLDYSKVPRFVGIARRHALGAPFLTFMYKAFPVIVEGAAKRPWKMAKYLALPYLLSMVTMGANDWDDDDFDKFKAKLPLYMRDSSASLIYPYKDKNGNLEIYNFDYTVPWAPYFNAVLKINNQGSMSSAADMLATGGLTLKTLAYDTFGFLGGPIPTGINMLANKDMFTGKPVWTEGATSEQKILEFTDHITKTMLPSWATSPGVFAKTWKAVNGYKTYDLQEEAITTRQALLSGVGISARTADPVRGHQFNIFQFNKELKNTKTAFRKELQEQRRKGASPEDLAGLRREYSEKEKHILERRRKYLEGTR